VSISPRLKFVHIICSLFFSNFDICSHLMHFICFYTLSYDPTTNGAKSVTNGSVYTMTVENKSRREEGGQYITLLYMT